MNCNQSAMAFTERSTTSMNRWIRTRDLGSPDDAPIRYEKKGCKAKSSQLAISYYSPDKLNLLEACKISRARATAAANQESRQQHPPTRNYTE